VGLPGLRRRRQLRVEGLEDLDLSRAYAIMANHQSASAEVLLAALPPSCAAWCGQALAVPPLLGWGMRAAGFLPVDRVNRSGAARLLAATAQRVREGRSLVLFPEETYGSG
jgi:1-acyl-sn-glycerol-3-phosphate acyltransferase